MEGEPNLPAPNLSAKSIQGLSSSSSPPDFLRNVQAAFKRHRPIGAMQSHNLMPRRSIQPHRDTSKPSILSSGLIVEAKKTQEVVSLNHGCLAQNLTGGMKETASSISEIQEDASITPPSISGTITNTCQDNHNPFGRKKNEEKLPSNVRDSDNVSYGVASKHVPAAEGSKKVQFALASSTISQEMEWDVAGQAEPSNVVDGESKHPMPMSIERDGGSQADGLSSSLASRISVVQDQIHLFKNFLESDSNHPMTQSSVVGSSCPTTTSVHATSAPMLNSTTHCSRSHQDSMAIGSLPDSNVNSLHVAQRDLVQQAHSSSMLSSGIKSDCAVAVTQSLNCAQSSQMHVKQIEQHHEREQNETLKDSNADHQLMEGKIEANDLPPQGASSKNSPADVKLESTNKLEKPVKAVTDKAPRKKSYDPDLFFKVNGKLYQRLGKIGSGGSSEVHKVISSDCKIYALKKIKLKGRDYATAYGFCQEILYLNKLKGKSNIIQLIDYEVTDKALLQEVMNDSINNKDSRVKDDGYIYMVLEYGEIDLAHMLSQKWKEVESSNSTIDENWLRFYWQQMLQAVNTIHEERIVHSDLKPANFLLVRGSLKLIDFGIAKAIMSDTTNIQRDAQVGTLSYMSPEAFMCNESDENGNVIKCGRPSDIWSLGCILYQMVYGRTPFSEYKTFWAKFKVITDPNHEITYAPVSHPWLLDLMKKCLAWDRNKRWRIPQLLQHPFLVPPVQELNLNAIQSIAESCSSDPEVAQSCLELRQVLGNTRPVSRDEQCRILSKISTICSQLQERIRNMD